MSDPARILIVDDETFISDSLAQFLQDYDFMVDAAPSAEDALERLATGKYHAAIVDIRLPKMDGDTFIIKAHEKDPDMRFVIHTGSVEYRLTPEIKKIGVSADCVFLKPLMDMSIIVDVLNRLIHRHG